MEPLIRDGRARKLSFTGSTGVGRTLLEQAADKVLRTSMELGGNAPFLVFADADLDAAVEGAMTAKMRNMGEACTAANRFLVHRSVADAFADKLAERMAALRVGRGTEDGVQVGPLVDAKSREKVVELVGDAVDRGATVRVGGDAVDGPGWFYRPTVLTGVPLEARLTKEEIFGPVAPISVFDTDDEAVAAANDTEFGLVSYLFTENLSRALRVSEALESGMVGLNTGLVSNPAAPFGGIKQSGLGREGGVGRHRGVPRDEVRRRQPVRPARRRLSGPAGAGSPASGAGVGARAARPAPRDGRRGGGAARAPPTPSPPRSAAFGGVLLRLRLGRVQHQPDQPRAAVRRHEPDHQRHGQPAGAGEHLDLDRGAAQRRVPGLDHPRPRSRAAPAAARATPTPSRRRSPSVPAAGCPPRPAR